MINRLAAALNTEIDRGLPAFTRQSWDKLLPTTQDALRGRVIAVLRALRDPDGAMLEAACMKVPINPHEARIVFVTMIDHILEREGQS
jgi:hypothetical protein